MKDSNSLLRSLALFMCIITITIFISPVLLSGQSISINSSDSDMRSEIIPRMIPSEADAALTNKTNSVNLMIQDDWLVIQFTDRYLKELQQEIHGKENEEEEEPVLAEVIRSMVGSGVRTLLDRALSISLHDIQGIRFQNGTLEIYNLEGERIFEDLEIDDTYIMQDFPKRDARRFVAAAEKRLP